MSEDELAFKSELAAERRQELMKNLGSEDLVSLLSTLSTSEDLAARLATFLPQHQSPRLGKSLAEVITSTMEVFRTHSGGSKDEIYHFARAFLNYVLINEETLRATETAGRKHIANQVKLQQRLRELEAKVSELTSLRESNETSIKELSASNTSLYRRTITDALTGMGNRAHFDAKLAEEVREAKRYDRPLSLLMVDIDHFKIINDTYGHQAGDFVLSYLLPVLKGSSSENRDSVVRGTDEVFRYGGEEIAVLASETDEPGAFVLGSKIVNRVQSTRFEYEGTAVPVTVSVGVSQLSPEDTDKSLIRKADQALYHVKHVLGRNNAITYNQIPR